MQIDKKSMVELSNLVAEAVVTALEKRGLVGKGKPKAERSAYQKTETLLYNYRGFKRIVEQRMLEIDNIKKYGVPERSKSIVAFTPKSGTVQGTVLPEDSVENAVQAIQDSIVDTVQAIELVDKGMAALKYDPYYSILEMRYFDGLTQEDIAVKFNVSQVTISNNKNRLVNELAMQLFPGEAVKDMLN